MPLSTRLLAAAAVPLSTRLLAAAAVAMARRRHLAGPGSPGSVAASGSASGAGRMMFALLG